MQNEKESKEQVNPMALPFLYVEKLRDFYFDLGFRQLLQRFLESGNDPES